MLGNSDHRSIAILTICSIRAVCAVNTVTAVIYGNLSALVEGYLIAGLHTILDDRNDTGHVIICLEGGNHCLESLYIGIRLIAERIETSVQVIDFLMDLGDLVTIDVFTADENETCRQDNVKNLLHTELC